MQLEIKEHRLDKATDIVNEDSQMLLIHSVESFNPFDACMYLPDTQFYKSGYSSIWYTSSIQNFHGQILHDG